MAAVKTTIPVKAVDGQLTAAEFNELNSKYNATVDEVNLKAPAASPAFTGTPTVPTAPQSTNNTQAASTAFVKAAIDALLGGVGPTGDTLVELFNLIASDESAITALNTAIGNKLNRTFDNIADAAAARTALGLGAVALLASIGIANVTGLQAALDAKAGLGANVFTGVQSNAAEALVCAPIINWNASNKNIFTVTLNQDCQLANPSNLIPNATYQIIIKQDSTGLRAMTFGSKFRWPNGETPTLSLDGDAIDILTGISDGTDIFVTLVQNFTKSA